MLWVHLGLSCKWQLKQLNIPGEAIHLARDFGYVCESEFPARQLAEYLCAKVSDTDDQHRRKELYLATRQVNNVKSDHLSCF